MRSSAEARALGVHIVCCDTLSEDQPQLQLPLNPAARAPKWAGYTIGRCIDIQLTE
jgi:hypothetical protein